MHERTGGNSIYERIRKIQIDVVKKAYQSGVRFNDLSPEQQFAPWFKTLLKILEEGDGQQQLTPEELEEIIRVQADSPDPFFG